MEKENKRGSLNLLVIILVVILIVAGIAIIITFMNKEETNEPTIYQNQSQYQENMVQNTTQEVENEIQTEPKDPVDDVPAGIVETPTDIQLDQVNSDNPTR